MKTFHNVTKILLALFIFSFPFKGLAQQNWYNPLDAGFPVIQNQGWTGELSHSYHRLPSRAEGKVRKAVWDLSRHSAGLAIHFYCDAPEIVVRYQVKGNIQMHHMPATGVSGLDLYSINNKDEWNFCFGDYSFRDTIQYTYPYLDKEGAPNGRFEYHLYLPLYNQVEWLEIGINEGSELSFIPASTERPIVVYGTSIAHGACASRPGMGWTNILNRRLDCPVINLGFSGNGRLEKEMMAFINEIDAHLFVLDCLPNLINQEEEEIYQLTVEAVREIRKRHTTPILLVEHIGYSNAERNYERREKYSRANKASKRAYHALLSEGISDLYYLSREELAIPLDGWVDTIHLSDWGMQTQAEAIEKKIKEIQIKEILNPVPFHEVMLEDQFWRPRLERQKEVLVPFALEKTEPAVENLRRTGSYLKGIPDELPFTHRFVASDLYKVMEGAAYLLTLEKDPTLEKKMDRIIDIITEAQQSDGYNYESHITKVAKHDENGMGETPYSYVVHSHELYNMGHMYEGAIAYYQATGKDKWLKLAEANARHINKVFFEGDPNYNEGKPINQAPGHQEIELALVKLFRVTGDSLYLTMAKKFIDIRGVTYRPEGTGTMAPEYAQQHLPVRQQSQAVGHAVRATYLYSAMADVSVYAEDPSLRPALDRIWHNIVDTRMHITGGLGAVHGIEGFGPEYELPNKDAFCETCAAVGNVFFNHRMFLMEKDGKYMDVAEVALLNNVLAGVNLEGNRFFYLNPLEADGIKPFNHGMRGRSPWFGTACCPSNLARLIPQVPGLMYATTGNEIYCAFYAASQTTLALEKGKVQLKQTTAYPFGETIRWEVTPERNGQTFAMKLRIPTWTGDQFVPGELYQYTHAQSAGWTIKVNGEEVKTKQHKGFATINRSWQKGDVVELTLPMPLRYSQAIEQVKADRGRICLTRGPLVYSAEGIDNGQCLPNVFITNTSGIADYSTYSDGVMQGIPRIRIPAWEKSVTEKKEVTLTLLPYYAWNNREDGSMMTWFPNAEQVQPYKDIHLATHGKFKDLEASYTYSEDLLAAVADNQIPTSSSDRKVYHWSSWGEAGKTQQITVTLDKPTDIQSVSVYWFEDNGGILVPQEWSLEYEANGKWETFPLYLTDAYNCFTDQFNMVHPGRQVIAEKIRLRMTPQPEKAVGILEINIEGNY